MDKEGIQVNIIRSDRKTLSLSVRPDGSLQVRAPYRMGQEQIMTFVASKLPWIVRQWRRLEQVEQMRRQTPPLTEEELDRLARQAREDLTARCRRFAPLVGVSYGRIAIRRQRTRWGSCSSKGNLNFNCLLMLAPEPVRDYVVVHELCHRKHMDHSARFWAEVERVLPDWQERRRWLREEGSLLLVRLE